MAVIIGVMEVGHKRKLLEEDGAEVTVKIWGPFDQLLDLGKNQGESNQGGFEGCGNLFGLSFLVCVLPLAIKFVEIKY